MLPHVTSQQLMAALTTDPKLEQDLCQCISAADATAAVARCLCADSSDEWWERSVTDRGLDANMTSQLYEVLVARFCGPATSVEVPTITTPRRTVELKRLLEAIAHTGLRMAILTLYPEQVALLNNPQLQRVFLWGPPGTGKTVILTLKGIQWRHQRKDVHLLNSHPDSRAAILLIEHQLLHACGESAAQEDATRVHVHVHMYDFENDGDVETAVEKLAAAADGEEIYILADEAFHGCNNSGGKFCKFITQLAAQVPACHLWAAAVDCVQVPPCVVVSKLTIPIRSPPAVVREVAKSRHINNTGVLGYSSSATPAPTDGPEIRMILHWTYNAQDANAVYTLLPGHAGTGPDNCVQCRDDIAHLLVELGVGANSPVGKSGQPLQYRDIIILCREPHDDLPVVVSLRDKGLPVRVVTSDDDVTAIRDVALAVHDVVIVTSWKVATGLERRIVIVMGSGFGVRDADDRLRHVKVILAPSLCR